MKDKVCDKRFDVDIEKIFQPNIQDIPLNNKVDAWYKVATYRVENI